MSFDLAVWEEPTPRTDGEALDELQRLRAQYLGKGASAPPSERIKAFIAALTERYPDITELPDDEVDDGVWSDGPLVDNASGPIFYFGIVGSRAEDVTEYVAHIAAEHGLVCFDPQSGRCVRGSA